MDVVCFYAGFGHKKYRDMALLMAKSARKQMPGIRLVHLTDRYTPKLEGFDAVIRGDADIPHEEIGVAKAVMISGYASQTQKNTVFTDPDIIFNKDIGELFKTAFDVGFSFNNGYAAHKAFNEGIILTRPKQDDFWLKYNKIASKLFPEAKAWWAGQLTIAMMLGVNHEPDQIIDVLGSRVWMLPHERLCLKPFGVPMSRMDSYTTHFTGDLRKEWMESYADL